MKRNFYLCNIYSQIYENALKKGRFKFLHETGEDTVMMLKDLMKCVREYKKASLQAPVLVSLEVVMECIIPFIISKLVNEIKA